MDFSELLKKYVLTQFLKQFYKVLDSIELKKKFIPSVLLSSESEALSG